MMKKILLFLTFLLMPLLSYATTLSVSYTNESVGGTISSSHWNQNFQDIQNWANNNNLDGTTNISTGGVTTSTIANLAVTDAKIATAGITTAGKVSGSALTVLSGIPSGAGQIPVANLATGTPTGEKYV